VRTGSSSRRSGNVVLMCRYQINPKVVVVDIHLMRVPTPPPQLTIWWTVRWTEVLNKDPGAVVAEWAEVLCVCVYVCVQLQQEFRSVREKRAKPLTLSSSSSSQSQSQSRSPKTKHVSPLAHSVHLTTGEEGV